MKKSPLNIVGIKNPINNYKEGYYGVSRKASPLNDMTEQENAQAAHHANLSINDKYRLDLSKAGSKGYDAGYDAYTDKHGYIDPDKYDRMMRYKVVEGEDDPALKKFYSSIHSLDNPEYSNPEMQMSNNPEYEEPRSVEYDYFIKNKSDSSEEKAKQLMALNTKAGEARKAKDFSTARATQKEINELLKSIR
tara:strand:+ start:57 stop:632 length:576 start_codon:yes stop_codon:yes gene_type:complete